MLGSLFCVIFSLSQSSVDTAYYTNPKNQDSNLLVKNIILEGNKVTRKHIILRELPFREGDTLYSDNIEKMLVKAEQNLMNTSLFNFAEASYTKIDSLNINIHIQLTERWYIWPVPIFTIEERNFNTWLDSRDFSRATYGFDLTHDNFRGRKEALSFRFRSGYTTLYGISYRIPYINKKQTCGIGFSIGYSQNHEVAYATKENTLHFYKDPEEFNKAEFSLKMNFSYRSGLYNNHYLEGRYYKGNVQDTVTYLSMDYPYYAGNQTGMEFISLNYLFRRDKRDYKYYPLKGYYFDVEITKFGLGLLKNEDLNVWEINTTLKKYWTLQERLFASVALKGKLSGNNFQPYSVIRGFGYGNYVRGYEYYVVDGYNFTLVKTGIKYQLVKPRVYKLPFIQLPQFSKFYYAMYVNLFSDVGYAENTTNFRDNNLANSFLFGTGIGIDIVSYYDAVLRIEYSFNRHGEKGFFLHLGAPI